MYMVVTIWYKTKYKTMYIRKFSGRIKTEKSGNMENGKNQPKKEIDFFNCCFLAAPWPNLGHYREASLTHPMLITCVLHIWPEGHLEPCSKVGSLSPAEHLVEFEPGTFWFWSQRLKPLGHSKKMIIKMNF